MSLADAEVVLFNLSAPVMELIKARLRRQEIVLRLDGIYHDRLSDGFITEFRSGLFRAFLRLGMRLGSLREPMTEIANFVDRNFPIFIRILLADRFIYQSEYSKRCWSRYFPRRKHSVIVNGARWNNDAPKCAPDDQIRLVTVYDDFRPAKRIDDLVEFIEWANENANVPVHLSILGFNGVFPKTYSERTKNLLGSSPYLDVMPRFSAITSGLVDVFKRSHAYVTFSFRDACPNTVVEAMAHGLPVVATTSGGLPDIVGDAGLLIPVADDIQEHFYACRYERDFPPIDFEAVLDATLVIARNNGFYRDRVRERFENNLDVSVIAARYVEAILEG